MNIKRVGAKRAGMRFGCCHSEEAVKRYALLEGFIFGVVNCLRCGVEYDLIIDPKELSRPMPKRIKTVMLPTQPCHKCGRNGIHLTIKRK